MNPPSISKIWFYKETWAKLLGNLAMPIIQQKFPLSQDKFKIIGDVPINGVFLETSPNRQEAETKNPFFHATQDEKSQDGKHEGKAGNKTSSLFFYHTVSPRQSDALMQQNEL